MDPILRPSDATNLAAQDTGREHLSHSRISMFLACHRKYELHYEERLERIDKRESLEMGKAFQKAIELQDPDVGPLMLDGWTEWVPPGAYGVGNLGSQGYSCYLRPPRELPVFHTQEAEDKHRINQAIVRAAAALYLRKWPTPVGETREFGYRVRLRNPWTGHYSRTFDLEGYADGIVDNQTPVDTGSYYIAALELVENKLVGRVDSVMVQRLPLDRQLALARYGIWRATGRPVSVVHYRWIKKPSIKPRQKESVSEFIERLEADYEEREDFYAYEPPPTFVPTTDLLRVECELWTWAEQLRALRRQRIYDRNTSACSDYGGCQFIPICSGDPDAMSLYQERPEREETRA